MTSDWLRPEVQLALLGGGGLLLVVLLLSIGRVVSTVPMKRSRRQLWVRLQPLLALFSLFAYAAFVTRVVLGEDGGLQPVAFILLGASVAGAGWFALRDFVAGVVLKASKFCQIGDTLRIGDLSGRVEQLGLRALTLETSQGGQAIVPYSQIAGRSVVRTPAVEGVAMHVFEVQASEGCELPKLRSAITEAALLSHYASIVREPLIKPLGEQRFEVTVFSLHSDYSSEIEAAVRRASLLR